MDLFYLHFRSFLWLHAVECHASAEPSEFPVASYDRGILTGECDARLKGVAGVGIVDLATAPHIVSLVGEFGNEC